MLDYTSIGEYLIVKENPEQKKKLQDFSQTLFDGLQEANVINSEFHHMELLIETLGKANVKNKEDLEKKIQSLYIKYKNLSDFSYAYVQFLLVYKEDYKTGLDLAKEIWEKDEKMRKRIEDEIFMEIATQVVMGNFQEYVLYGLKIFGVDMKKFIKRYHDASSDKNTIMNYNKALKYIDKNIIQK